MWERCDQCGYRKPGDDNEGSEGDYQNYETWDYLCECEVSDDELTPAQEQNINLAKMQLGRINAFKSQDTEKGNFDVTFDLSGKLLYAHKIMITTVSTVMEAMISERWSANNETIKIETYTYEEFFQFLTFLYSGTCDITQDNISRLIDMTEFFNVAIMKEHCDKYLSKLIQNIGVETVEEMLEISEKYSLSKSIGAVKKFIHRNKQKIIEFDAFVEFKRPFLDVLFSVPNNNYHEEQLFLSVIKWIEHQVSTKEPTLEGTDFLDAVKTEWDEIKLKFDFSKMDADFVMESIVSKGFPYSTSDLYKILGECNRAGISEEKYFQTIFEIAERQALKEQAASTDEKFNLQTVIERELSEILPKVNFERVWFYFVKQFVVEKAFLFSSKELYKIIAECRRTDKQESEVFEMLYELAKKNVEIRNLPGEITDLPYAIKMELSECLPKIKFYKMNKNYLIDFADKTRFISLEEAIRCFSDINVQIKSGGKLLNGNFEDVFNIHKCANKDICQIDSGWKFYVTPRSVNSVNKLRFAGLKFDIPHTSSPVHFMHGVDWYLLLEADGTLAVKHRSMVKHVDYLIAELRSTEEFSFAKENTRLTVSHNSIF